MFAAYDGSNQGAPRALAPDVYIHCNRMGTAYDSQKPEVLY